MDQDCRRARGSGRIRWVATRPSRLGISRIPRRAHRRYFCEWVRTPATTSSAMRPERRGACHTGPTAVGNGIQYGGEDNSLESYRRQSGPCPSRRTRCGGPHENQGASSLVCDAGEGQPRRRCLLFPGRASASEAGRRCSPRWSHSIPSRRGTSGNELGGTPHCSTNRAFPTSRNSRYRGCHDSRPRVGRNPRAQESGRRCSLPRTGRRRGRCSNVTVRLPFEAGTRDLSERPTAAGDRRAGVQKGRSIESLRHLALVSFQSDFPRPRILEAP